MSKELKQYIRDALTSGQPRDDVRQTLVTSGWAGDVVDKLLDHYVGTDPKSLPIPAPTMSAHHLARDLFTYLLLYVTLTLSVFSLGTLFFDWADGLFPDTLNRNSYHWYGHSLTWAIACLLIAFPVFLGLQHWIDTTIARHPEKRESFVRKLMIYWMLVKTAIISLCDLIWVVTAFLDGNLAANSIAKTVIILGICGGIFAYYLQEVRKDDKLVRSA